MVKPDMPKPPANRGLRPVERNQLRLAPSYRRRRAVVTLANANTPSEPRKTSITNAIGIWLGVPSWPSAKAVFGTEGVGVAAFGGACSTVLIVSWPSSDGVSSDSMVVTLVKLTPPPTPLSTVVRNETVPLAESCGKVQVRVLVAGSYTPPFEALPST